MLKVAIAVVAVLAIGGVLAIAGVMYAAHNERTSQTRPKFLTSLD